MNKTKALRLINNITIFAVIISFFTIIKLINFTTSNKTSEKLKLSSYTLPAEKTVSKNISIARITSKSAPKIHSLQKTQVIPKNVQLLNKSVQKMNTTPLETLPIINPAIFNQQMPQYPIEAQKQGIEGALVLKVLVEKEGNPSIIIIEKSSSHVILDNAAVTAVNQWQFLPAKQGNGIVSSWMVIPVNFSLSE